MAPRRGRIYLRFLGIPWRFFASAIIDGEFSHLFTNPEAILQVPKWRKFLLPTDDLIAIAIDEAHCCLQVVSFSPIFILKAWHRGTYHLPYDCQVTYILTLTVLVLFQFRGMGEVFREWYGKVSQLRSLAHTNTPVLALTATSTLNVRTKIMQHLWMGSCTVIQGSLDRPNIRYSAVKVHWDLQVTFGWLLQEI